MHELFWPMQLEHHDRRLSVKPAGFLLTSFGTKDINRCVRQIIKSAGLLGLALSITIILITATAVWREEMTVGQILKTVGLSDWWNWWNGESQTDKVQPTVSHLEDPFLAQKVVTIKFFDDKSVALVLKDGGETLTYALNEEFLVLRVNNPRVKIKSYSVSVLTQEDLGKDARLVPIYIRPKPELPEKQVLGLYL